MKTLQNKTFFAALLAATVIFTAPTALAASKKNMVKEVITNKYVIATTVTISALTAYAILAHLYPNRVPAPEFVKIVGEKLVKGSISGSEYLVKLAAIAKAKLLATRSAVKSKVKNFGSAVILMAKNFGSKAKDGFLGLFGKTNNTNTTEATTNEIEATEVGTSADETPSITATATAPTTDHQGNNNQ